MDTALLLETQEREAESSQTLSDHTSATQLLRLQVEDLQKRLQEKDDKLSEAQQIIRGLQDEILALQRQLEVERRKSLDTVHQEARKPHKVQFKRVYKQQARKPHKVQFKRVNEVSQHSSPSSENQPTALSGSLHNDATSSRRRLSLRSSVRLEDWGHRLNPDGVFLLPPVEHDDDDYDDINDDNDYIPDEAADVVDINDDNDYAGDRQRTQKRPLPAARIPKLKEAQSTKRASIKTRGHECGTCGKWFAKPCLLRKHETVHSTEKPYPCECCGKAFSQARYAKMHFKRRHSSEETRVVKEKTHQCQDCGKMFSSSSNLKSHQIMHTGDRPYPCTLCDKRFFSPSSLDYHKKWHAGVRPFMCSDCGQSFTSSSQLRIHMRRHTGERPYQCSQCPKAFTCAGALKAHLLTHTGEKPHACPDCGLTFGRVSTLNRHKITHTGVRSHLCPICGKSFGQAGVLKTHLRVHTGEKPHRCTICGERFSQVQTLQSHQKRAHFEKEQKEQTSSARQEVNCRNLDNWVVTSLNTSIR